MSQKEKQQVIADIEQAICPDTGWWKSGTGETIRKAADIMIQSGLSVDLTKQILLNVTSAIRGEYGE